MRKSILAVVIVILSTIAYVVSTHGQPAERAAATAGQSVMISLDQDHHATQFSTRGFVVTYTTGYFPNSKDQPSLLLTDSGTGGFGLKLPIYSGGPDENDQTFFSASLNVSFAKGDTVNIEAKGLPKWHVNLYGYYN